MEDSSGHHWHRPGYPLETSTKHSVPAATTASTVDEADTSGSAHPTKLPDGNLAGDSSLEPVADAANGISKYSIMSKLGNDTTFALRKSIDDILASSEDSTAVEKSTSSPSPPSSSHSHPHVSAAEPPASSPQQSVRYQRDTSNTSSAWSRSSYPLHPPGLWQQLEQAPAHVAGTDQSTTGSRTLRRTLRSGCLRESSTEPEGGRALSEASTISPVRENDRQTPTGPRFYDFSQPETATNQWQRQVYPLQTTTAGNQFEQPAKPRLHTSPKSAEDSAPIGTPGCPLRQEVASDSGTGALPSPSMNGNAADTLRTSTNLIRESGQSVNESQPFFSRKTYPLQMPASNANLRGSPTPPPSPPKEEQSESKSSGAHDHVTRSSKKPRGNYPLHSPPSIIQLRASPSPPPSPKKTGREAEVGMHESQGSEQALSARKGRTFRRLAYPLQSAASVSELRPSASSLTSLPENEPSHTSRLNLAGSIQNDNTHEPIHVFHRRGYPLQPSSAARPMSVPSQQPLTAGDNSSSPYGDASAHFSENVGAASKNRPLRRGYPLASQPSIPALQILPPSPPSETEGHVVDEQPASNSRDYELASKAIKQWRRQVYPMQSPENASPFQREPTPQPPEEAAKRDPSPSPKYLPKHIPAVKDSTSHEPEGRTIIVCLDGTGDKFDDDNSNIVHLVSALKKDDPKQVSYYQAGLGTYTTGGLNTGFSAAMDMAVGSELGLHVRDAYQFLMHAYKEGDKICIFGFSRGAYTARCLAGMVHKVGLLPPRNLQQIYFAYQFYANDSPEGWKSSRDFKATFSIDVSVYFLGCFDSVASVGFIPRQLPLSTTPTNKCRYFRHAMALDERRAKFKVCRYQTVDWDDIQIGTSQTETKDDLPAWHPPHEKYGPKYHPNVTDEEYERLEEPDASWETDVNEVWFAGCHADIGGGAVPNVERHKLAQIPLRWMIRQAFECNTGIRFKTKKLAEFGLDVHTLWPQYRSLVAPTHGPPPSFLEKYDEGLPPRSIRRSKLVPTEHYQQGERLYHLQSRTDDDWTPEQVEDFYDAMAPLNDQLVDAPNWWILEAWPVQYKVPIGRGQVELRTGMNLGRYRAVGDFEPNLHWTVLHRVQHRDYKIQVRMAPHTKWRIVV